LGGEFDEIPVQSIAWEVAADQVTGSSSPCRLRVEPEFLGQVLPELASRVELDRSGNLTQSVIGQVFVVDPQSGFWESWLGWVFLYWNREPPISLLHSVEEKTFLNCGLRRLEAL